MFVGICSVWYSTKCAYIYYYVVRVDDDIAIVMNFPL